MSVIPGYGVGDIIAVSSLAWKIYKSFRDAPKNFKNISTELLSLHAVLKEVEEAVAANSFRQATLDGLATILTGCRDVLTELEALMEKYKGLGAQTRWTWDRMHWHAGDVAELRQRMTSNVGMLTAWMSMSQVAVEQELRRFIREYRAGLHESSIISIQSIQSLSMDDRESWEQIRIELDDVGITVEAFEQNKDFIIAWLRNAIANGDLDEQPVADPGDNHGVNGQYGENGSNEDTDNSSDARYRRGHGGIGFATRNPEFASQENPVTNSSESRRSTRSVIPDSNSYPDVNLASLQISDEPRELKKWQVVGRRKVCGIIPIWCLILVGISLILLGVILGSILATLQRQPKKDLY